MTAAPNSSSSTPQARPIFNLLPNICNLVPIRLDRSNFSQWKYLMTTILKAYNLFRYVDGSLKFPARCRSYSEAEIDLMKPKDQIMYREDQGVMALINATLSSTVLDCVMECTTSRELWLQLDNIFGPNFAPVHYFLLFVCIALLLRYGRFFAGAALSRIWVIVCIGQQFLWGIILHLT